MQFWRHANRKRTQLRQLCRGAQAAVEGMLAASSGSKAFYAPPRRDVRPQRGSRRLQPARASSSSSTSSNIYKPRVPFVDLYEVLALEPSATDGEVKTAYRILQKAVHPDLAGEYASAAAALVNEAASVLTSPADRARFDRDRSEWLASGRGSSDQSLMDPSPLSAWSGPSEGEPEDDRGRHDAAFVDESACIGCLKCALIAPTTFWIETRFGCARVVDQWADGREAVEDAVAACPVQCIHFVNRRAELPLLERVAARQWRDGGSGGGANRGKAMASSMASPFVIAASLGKRAARGDLIAWPSRRAPRASSAGVNTADAAVAAAAAAAAAASEASAWAEATGGEASDEDGDSASSGAVVAVARFIDREVTTGAMFGGNAASVAYSSGRRGPSSRIGGSSEEVARVNSLLERGSGGEDEFDPQGVANSTAEFWEPLPDWERPASASFEGDDDGGYAPTEWLQSMRRNRGGLSGVDSAERAFESRGKTGRARRRQSRFSGVSPLATVSLALTIAFGTRLLFGAPQDAVAGVDPTIVVNGVVATDLLTSEWAALGCSTLAWTAVLNAAMLVADSVAFVAAGDDDA